MSDRISSLSISWHDVYFSLILTWLRSIWRKLSFKDTFYVYLILIIFFTLQRLHVFMSFVNTYIDKRIQKLTFLTALLQTFHRFCINCTLTLNERREATTLKQYLRFFLSLCFLFGALAHILSIDELLLVLFLYIHFQVYE